MIIIDGMIWVILASLPLTAAICWQSVMPQAPLSEEVFCVIREKA